METLVIGLDGGEWDIIDSMIEDKQLPNLAHLVENGVSGDLESIDPPVSPPAWSSIHTGVNPGKHGIFDFSEYDEEYRRKSVNATDRAVPSFWKMLNDEGVSTGLFKVPFTYPPQPVDGYIVTGFPTPSTVEDFAYPDAITEDIDSPTLLFEDWSSQSEGDYVAFKDNLLAVARRQTDLFLDLVDQYDADVQMTVYDGCDRIQHFFWKYFDEDHPRYTPDDELSDAIAEYYRVVDGGIGEILDVTGPKTDVIVISDHGFGPLSYDIRIDDWLNDNGYLSRFAEDSSTNIRKRALSTLTDCVWQSVRRVGLEGLVRDILPKDLFLTGKQLRDTDAIQTNWEQTTAFFATQSGQALFVNLEDRFVDGTVHQSEYQNLVEELRHSLLKMRTAEGEQVIEAVHRTDELFEGPEIDRGPDLIVESAPEYTLKGGRGDTLVEPSKHDENDRSGDHRKDGILVAQGPSFEEGMVEGASVVDIAPTLLHLHGCAVPKPIDGQVLTGALSDDLDKVTYTPEYRSAERKHRKWTNNEQAELEDRLADMGYLE